MIPEGRFVYLKVHKAQLQQLGGGQERPRQYAVILYVLRPTLCLVCDYRQLGEAFTLPQREAGLL